MKMSMEEKYLKNRIQTKADPELDYFFTHARHDMKFFLKSITNESSSIFTFFGDADQGLYYISDNLKKTFGFSHNVVRNFLTKWSSLIYTDKYKSDFLDKLREVINGDTSLISCRYPVLNMANEVVWIQCSAQILRDDENKPIFIAGRLIKQSDSFAVSELTRLPLLSTFKSRLELFKKYNKTCLVLGINLLHIDKINLEYGRQLGDTLIKELVDSCLNKLITKLQSYSISGTKYLAIVEYDAEEEIKEILSYISLIADRVYKKYGVEVDRSVSFVVMKFYPDKFSTNEFIENIISLISASKNNISGNYLENTDSYIEKIHENAKMTLALLSDVTHGMKGFSLNIQPILDSLNEKIIAGECLLRWSYNNTNISPTTFIPILENNSLISIAGKWVIEKAIEILKPIIKQNPNFYLTINISKKQLEDEDLPSYIEKTIKDSSIDSKNIVFEITENVMEGSSKALYDFINFSQSLNIRIAIDDFGTGYSNLFSFLKHSYDILKIDRTVLLELERSEKNLDLVSALLSSCKKNNVKICVEGVETDHQKEISKTLNADMIQGYYYYRPLRVNDFLNIINK